MYIFRNNCKKYSIFFIVSAYSEYLGPMQTTPWARTGIYVQVRFHISVNTSITIAHTFASDEIQLHV